MEDEDKNNGKDRSCNFAPTGKVYQIEIQMSDEYAELRANPNQSIPNDKIFDVYWENWNVRGNLIADFVFCIYHNICKESVFETLQENFTGLKQAPLNFKKTPQEETAKNIKRLKWLPREFVPLVKIYTDVEIELLPQSTVTYEGECIKEINGISKQQGNLIIPREKDKGFFFDKASVKSDFFKPTNTDFFLCTERVKEFCEEQKYENVLFLEVGDIVPLFGVD